jgi:hypothetical protein
MRNAPTLIRCVAMETTAQMVVDATPSHLLQRVRHQTQQFSITGALVFGQQQIEIHVGRKLGRPAKAAVELVKTFLHLYDRCIDQSLTEAA